MRLAVTSLGRIGRGRQKNDSIRTEEGSTCHQLGDGKNENKNRGKRTTGGISKMSGLSHKGGVSNKGGVSTNGGD